MSKKSILKIILISISLSFIFYLVFPVRIEGAYISHGDTILFNDYQGYVCYKNGKVYSVNLSTQLKDDAMIVGTYKHVEGNKYFIDKKNHPEEGGYF